LQITKIYYLIEVIIPFF